MDEPVWPVPEKWMTAVIGGPLPFECAIKVKDEAMRSVVERLHGRAMSST
jgi:hypothetical protein